MKRFALVVGLALAVIQAAPSSAQTPGGYGTILTVPVVVQSGTYQSQLFIHNSDFNAIVVDPIFYGADQSATVGAFACPSISVPGGTVLRFSLTTLCPGLNAGSNFGRLRFSSNGAQNSQFTAYSRVQTVSGDGFSIEAFPIGNFANITSDSYVLGLRRQAAAPGYASNCFIAALQEPVSVNVSLYRGDGSLLASPVTVSLSATEVVRLLDVFAQLGAPPGDYSNIQAKFSPASSSGAAYVGFCTVQNNSSFDADFRIAKAVDPADDRMSLTVSTAVDGLGNALAVAANQTDVQAIFLQHPDWVSCSITGPNVSVLEIRLKDPLGNVAGGGHGATSVPKFYLGEKTTRNAGANGMWTLEVSPVAGSGPYSYGLSCQCGNGCSIPLRVGTVAGSF